MTLLLRLSLLWVFLLLFSSAPVLARPKSPAPARPLPTEPAARVALRRPDPARLREMRSQREFRYVEVKSEQSAWGLFWARFWHWLDGLLSTRGGKIAWDYGIYALLVVALVIVVLQLMRVDVTWALGRGPRGGLLYTTEAEDIHGLDFTALLTEAEAAGNFRLAVRLGYLLVLKQLTDQGLIRWQPDKTNQDYLQELTANSLRPAFRELTRQFEYVWYGQHSDLSADDYAAARQVRLSFQQQLATVRHAAVA